MPIVLRQVARQQEGPGGGESRKRDGRTMLAGHGDSYANKAVQSDLSDLTIDRSSPIVPQIYRLLRQRIIDNRLPPGAEISEGLLAGHMGVSRTPLRAALQQLAAEGLIQTRPQVGSVVAPFDQARVEEAVFVRGALEEAIVRRLAETGIPKAELAPNLAAQKVAAEMDDYMTFFRFDEEFHAMLARFAQAPNAWSLIQGVKAHVDRQRLVLMSSIVGRSMKAYDEHLAILREIEAGRPEGAVLAMRTHVCSVLDTDDLRAPRSTDD